MKKEKHPVCDEARFFYYDFITHGQDVPAEIAGHIEACSLCREECSRLQTELEAGRQIPFAVSREMLRVQMPLFDQWVGCVQARPFLAVFSAAGLLPEVPTPAGTHMAHCPACREDFEAICALHLGGTQTALAGRYLAGDEALESQIDFETMQVLRRIRQRSASGVLTRIRRDEQTGQFTVSVGSERADAETGTSKTHLRRPVRLAGGGLAAAAVLLIGVLLLWMAPSVKGLDIAEVYRAVGNVLNVSISSYQAQPGENVKITSYAQEDAEPIQQIWISNVLDIQLYIEKDKAVLWDLSRQQRITRTPAGLEAAKISDSVKELEVPWGLLPFRSVSELPAGYQWNDVQDENLPKEPDTVIYDLTWTQPLSGGRQMTRKWRGYLNAYSKLPYRIEWWDQLPGQEFMKMTTVLIAYPENEEVLERIRAEGFDYLPGDQM